MCTSDCHLCSVEMMKVHHNITEALTNRFVEIVPQFQMFFLDNIIPQIRIAFWLFLWVLLTMCNNWLPYWLGLHRPEAIARTSDDADLIHESLDLLLFKVNFTVSIILPVHINTLRPRQNGRHFPDDTFESIFLNENVRISIKISLKFVTKGSINNIKAMVQIMAWRRPGDKPLSEPMIVSLPMHICITRPQWANQNTDDI